jgi:hypothetical protein
VTGSDVPNSEFCRSRIFGRIVLAEAEYSAEKKVSASILKGQLHAIGKKENNTNLWGLTQK